MSRARRPRTPQTLVATLTGSLALLAFATAASTGAHAAVACTQTISGPHTGVISVAANQKLCLVAAVQDSAINVAPGGALSVVGSTITGATTLSSGFSTLDFCGSTTIRGAISATVAGGAVLIGGTGLNLLSCPANTIDGAVTLSPTEPASTSATTPSAAQ